MDKFVSFRDHFFSLYQSIVGDVARQLDEKNTSTSRASFQRSAASVLPQIAADIAGAEFARQRGLTPPSTGDNKRELTKTEIGRVCADLTFRYLKARLANDTGQLAQLNDEFRKGTCDPAWLSTIEEYLRYFGPDGSRREIPYIRASTIGPKVIEIPSDAKIALVGDWGTGAQPALRLLKHIADEKPEYLIHLGDIYYSGTSLECQQNFLRPINAIIRATRQDAKVFTLAGNHDMYCGGVGYYDIIKTLNDAPFDQGASFFCLRTSDERWQFLAMDTGLHDYSPLSVAEAVTYLEPDELEWHSQRIDEFPGRTIILSHHQLFSAFSAIGQPVNGKRSPLNPNLYEAFRRLNHSNKVAAWFWGHEHTLSIYQPFKGLERGRCVGHGAVPTSVIDKIYEPLSDLDQTPLIIEATQLSPVGGVYAHGYTSLSLKSGTCSAAYLQDVGSKVNVLFEEKIT
jgi:Calcineurin-like phosphoesterase